MKRLVLSIVLLLTAAPVAMAQNLSASPAPAPEKLGMSFAPRAAASHHGFTVFINIGAGVQKDEFYGETSTGLAGLNFGVGWYVADNVAVLFRGSGTRGSFQDGDVDQVSGVFGGTIQFWLNQRFAIEGGAGLGRWSDNFGDSDTGFGIIAGVTAVLVQRGSHHITAGAEYAPVFTTDGTVHNIGFVVGYLFARSR